MADARSCVAGAAGIHHGKPNEARAVGLEEQGAPPWRSRLRGSVDEHSERAGVPRQPHGARGLGVVAVVPGAEPLRHHLAGPARGRVVPYIEGAAPLVQVALLDALALHALILTCTKHAPSATAVTV